MRFIYEKLQHIIYIDIYNDRWFFSHYLNDSLIPVIICFCLGVLIDYINYYKKNIESKSSNSSKLFYSNLTYQEKFKRTLQSTPFIALSIISILLIGGNVILQLITIFVIISLFISQLMYNLKKSKIYK